MNIQRLVNEGARIAPSAMVRLAARLEILGAEVDEASIDNTTYRALYPVVKKSEKAGACDYAPSVIAEALGLTDRH